MTPEKQEVLWEKLVELKETPGKDGEAPEKRGEPKSRGFWMTPEKEEVLREKLVELKETPRKAGEAPEKRGEPGFWMDLKIRNYSILLYLFAFLFILGNE